MTESKDVEGWVSLPMVLVGDTDGEPISPFDYVPLASIMLFGVVSAPDKQVLKPS